MAPGQTVDITDLPPELTQMQDGAEPAFASMQALTPALAQTESRAAHAGGYVLAQPAPGYLGRADPGAAAGWIGLLEMQAASMLSAGQSEVMDVLGRQFESALIKTALKHTHGRKNDAAVRLGIGRNTITRKIAELGIDGAKDE